MNEEFYNKELNHDEMKELLPDYAFGRLTENEVIVFENNLGKYPDLKEEIVEIQSVFSRSTKENIVNELEEKTKNMSFKVQNRMYKNKSNNYTIRNVLKFAAPALALVLVFLIARNLQLEDVEQKKSLESIEFITANEFNIIEEEVDETMIHDPLYSQGFTISENIDKEAAQSYLETASPIEVEAYMTEMSEAEFINFLKELDNEKFSI